MKTAVITGAASGIGYALSLIYLKQGATVCMIDKDSTKLNFEADSLQSQFPGQVIPKICDVTDFKQVSELAHSLAQDIKHIDWIYNNAGIIGPLSPVWELKPEEAQQVMEVNLYGMMHMIQAFMPLLLEQAGASQIVNMASLYALSAGTHTAAYSMSKHAVLALSEALYFDLQPLQSSIGVSVVFPSFTDTGLLNKAPKNPLQESLGQLLSHSRPPEDVALYIAQQVAQKKFYILPDKEVSVYAHERVQAIIAEQEPYVNNIEKLMSSLLRRSKLKKVP